MCGKMDEPVDWSCWVGWSRERETGFMWCLYVGSNLENDIDEPVYKIEHSDHLSLVCLGHSKRWLVVAYMNIKLATN